MNPVSVACNTISLPHIRRCLARTSRETWHLPAHVGRSPGGASVTPSEVVPAPPSAHGLLDQRGFPCLVGRSQLHEREGARPSPGPVPASERSSQALRLPRPRRHLSLGAEPLSSPWRTRAIAARPSSVNPRDALPVLLVAGLRLLLVALIENALRPRRPGPLGE